jgi:hypothetical protein
MSHDVVAGARMRHRFLAPIIEITHAASNVTPSDVTR